MAAPAILLAPVLALRPVLALSDPWQCDVRAWTRAPDLYPGASLPAEARLALNGSDCGDVLNWAVGLRLRERAIIKKRAKTAISLPSKPVSPSQCNNGSCFVVRNDWNDIYNPTDRAFWMDEWKDQKYLEAVKEYEASIRNESLWDVNSVERVVFDMQQALPFKVADSHSNVDLIELFNVHVPMTNFPPMDVYESSFRHQGSDQQMFATETQFEYYHNITLADGTVRIIPAGKSGFLPSSTPIESKDHASWPRSIDLKSPHIYTADPEDTNNGQKRHRHKAPDCDKDNAATFHVTLEPDSLPVQGRNITCTITLTRQGNGSEYPRYIDLYPFIEHEMQWARAFFNTEEEYQSFLGQADKHYPARGSKMLMIKPLNVLEEDRAAREERAENRRVRMAMSHHFGDGKFPIGQDGARHDFEENHEEEKDEYKFEVELPIAYDALPSFARTFDDLRSVLEISVHTAFSCEDDKGTKLPLGAGPVRSQMDSTARDENWTEYELPMRIPAPPRSNNRYFSHRARIPLNVVMANPKALQGIKAYTDPTALAPVLSLGPQTTSSFKALGSGWRDETPEERLISRYRPNDGSRQRGWCKIGAHSEGCWELNGGGAGMHAAKLWQRVEMERAEKEDRAHGFVIQG